MGLSTVLENTLYSGTKTGHDTVLAAATLELYAMLEYLCRAASAIVLVCHRLSVTAVVLLLGVLYSCGSDLLPSAAGVCVSCSFSCRSMVGFQVVKSSIS